MKEIAPGIILWDNVFPEALKLVEEIESTHKNKQKCWEPSMVYNKDDEPIIDSYSRNCEIFGIPDTLYDFVPEEDHPEYFKFTISNKFKEAFRPCYEDYISKFHVENNNQYDNYSILKYGSGQKFIKHVDDGKKCPRRVSLVYYINDNYEGGEIVFPNWSLSLKPKANQLLMFPSNFMYAHEVKPVTNGTRYSVVQWLY